MFLTTANTADKQLQTVCLDRSTGDVLWRRTAPAEKIVRGHRTNSPASSSPVVDGERVYVYFGSYGVIAYNLDGEEQWRIPLPAPVLSWGAGCSPVVAGNILILNQDQDLGAHLLALDTRTGETKWKADRADFRRGFSTPLVLPHLDQVVLSGSQRVAYDLRDGREVWTARGLPYQVSASPILFDGHVYIAAVDGLGGGSPKPYSEVIALYDQDSDGTLSKAEFGPHSYREFPKFDRNKDGMITKREYVSFKTVFDTAGNGMLAIRADGHGDVTDTHVIWKATKSLPHIPSVVGYRGRIHTIRNGGVTTCYDAKNGTQIFRERLPDTGTYYASPVATDGTIYFSSLNGVVTVIESADSLKVLAKNVFGEEITASPAIVDSTLYIRTAGHLYAIGH